MATDVFGILRLEERKQAQKRSALDELMTMLDADARSTDTNEGYDKAIKNITALKGTDELLDLSADIRIKKLGIEKENNLKIQELLSRGAGLIDKAKSPYDPNNPTAFDELINDFTTEAAKSIKYASKSEIAQIDNVLNTVQNVAKSSGVAREEKLYTDYLEKRGVDSELLNVMRQTKRDDTPQLKAMAVSGLSSGSSSDQLSPKDFYGLGAKPNAENIVDSYQGNLIAFNTSLQQIKALAKQSGMNSVFDVGTEGLTSDAKNKQDTNYFFNQKKVMANLINSMVPAEIKQAVEKRYSETMEAQFDAGTLKDDNGNVVTNKSTFNYMIGSMASKDGVFKDQYINDLIAQMQMDNEANLKENLRKVYPPLKPKTFGNNREHRRLFEGIKDPARNVWKDTIKMWRQASKYNNDVNMLLNPANKILDDMGNQTDTVSPFNYQIFSPTQYLNNANKVDD